MNFQTQCAPVFSVIESQLNSGEQVIAQPDSMVSMTSGMRIRAATGTGVAGRSWRAGFRSLLGGESFFRAIFGLCRAGAVAGLSCRSCQGDGCGPAPQFGKVGYGGMSFL